MQESPEHVLNEAKRIVDIVLQNDDWSLCFKGITKRLKVIDKILNWLSVDDKNSWYIRQAIPIELISCQLQIDALCFAEISIASDNLFLWDVLEKIIAAAIFTRKELDMEWDIQNVDAITKVLHSLFRKMLEIDQYANDPAVYLLIGTDAEYIGQPSDAIDIYKKAMELGSMESYLRIASIYDSQQNYAMGIEILEEWYKLSWDIIFLKSLVRMYYENGDLETASARYNELSVKDKRETNPFLVYKWKIDNDENLDVFENLMNEYLSKRSLEPKQALTNLSVSASKYIDHQIDLVNVEIDNMDKIPENEQSDIDKAVYLCWITRRLYLMQNHIITLRDSKYLDLYLDDVKKFGIDGNDEEKRIIRTYFEEYFSTLVLSEYQNMTNQHSHFPENMDLFEMIRVHIIQIAAIFWQWSYYDLLLEKMQPIVDECLRREWSIEDIAEPLDMENAFRPLKAENDLYESLPGWMKRSFEDFIEYFDNKYGTYYRRTIQIFARDGEYDESEHSDILKNYSDIALLFWIEKILNWWLSSEDEEPDMEDIVSWYHLDTLEPINALLFAGFLFEGESQFETAIDLLINTPGIFDYTSTLLLIAEALHLLETNEDRELILSKLDDICRDQYGATDFFNHVENIFIDTIDDAEASDNDIFPILFAYALSCHLQKDVERAIVYLQEAALYEPMKSYREIGDIYSRQWNHEKTIESYWKSYRSDPSLAWISRLIGYCTESREFSSAKEYIDIAILDGYDVSGYIFAYYLWSGQEKMAMEKMIEIIGSEGKIQLVLPDGTLEQLAITIERILESDESSYEMDTLKILASYVDIQYLSDKDDVDSVKFVEHFAYINVLFDQYEWEVLYWWIENTIWQMVCDQSDPDEDTDRTMLIMRIIQAHCNNMYDQLMDLHQKYIADFNLELVNDTHNDITTLVGTMAWIFERFPDWEEDAMGWRQKANLPSMKYDTSVNHDISMIHEAPNTIQ